MRSWAQCSQKISFQINFLTPKNTCLTPFWARLRTCSIPDPEALSSLELPRSVCVRCIQKTGKSAVSQISFVPNHPRNLQPAEQQGAERSAIPWELPPTNPHLELIPLAAGSGFRAAFLPRGLDICRVRQLLTCFPKQQLTFRVVGIIECDSQAGANPAAS